MFEGLPARSPPRPASDKSQHVGFGCGALVIRMADDMDHRAVVLLHDAPEFREGIAEGGFHVGAAAGK